MAEVTISQLDLSNSRILTVASSIEKALDLIARIQRLPKSSGNPDLASKETPNKVPWTISNKYYSADVHFAAHPIKGLAPYQVQNVPAVLFVWSKGEEYRSHILRLAQDLQGYEPEVVLAVRTHTSSPISPEDRVHEEEEDGEIDEFLSEHGFEFVDAIDEDTSSSEEGPYFSQGIPTLPRVLDALSTIMWPNMKRPSQLSSSGHRGVGRLLDLTPDSRENSVASIDHLVSQSADTPEKRNRRQKEMDALERWLEEDVHDGREDPWKMSLQKDVFVHSPVEGANDLPGAPPSKKPTLAFDDDFSVFVSAPPADDRPAQEAPSHPESTPDSKEPKGRLTATPLGELYHALGSTSDLGEMDAQFPSSSSQQLSHTHDDNDSDSDGLPTTEEIRATATRLFGSERAASFDESFDFDNPEYEMAPFDLSHVMSALQVMKSEISNMQDEGEKRKMAASVALSLVYGLEGQPANST